MPNTIHPSPGWTPNHAAMRLWAESVPSGLYAEADALCVGDDNRDALNYRALVKCLQDSGQTGKLARDGEYARLRSRNQGSVGSCVGFGTATPLDVLKAVEILSGEPEQWRAMFSADALYAMGRHIAGRLGRWDGSYGSAAARAITEWGTVHELVYGQHDLTSYSAPRAREWARVGVPAEVREAATDHTVRRAILVRNGDTAWSLLGQGYPINCCSSLGFRGSRDAEGIMRRGGSWMHSMAVTSRRTSRGGNRLVLFHQSWGDDWASGPYWQDQPLGSFWADLCDLDWACRAGEVIAYAGYNGFIRRDMRWGEW